MIDETKDPMEHIWERVPKTKEGLIRYLAGDLPYLYHNGFVDTNRFSLDEWVAAFDDCKKEDDSYLISKEKFLSLGVFRYIGPVLHPFDPHKIKEGEWEDEKLKLLYNLSVKPSSTLPEDIYWNTIENLKKQGCLQNGKFLLDNRFIKQLIFLLDQYPSPRRKLEIEVDRIRKEREETLNQNTKVRDTSNFVVGKTNLEVKKEAFKNLETKAKIPDQPSNAKGEDIKKFRRPASKISA